MLGLKKILLLLLAFGLAQGGIALPAAGQVIRHPQPTSPLAERFDWALQQAEKDGLAKGFWVGFSIQRLMGEHSLIGSFSSEWVGRSPSLEDLICGKKTASEKKISEEQAVREAATQALSTNGRGKPERTVIKDIAILLKYASAASREPSLVVVSNLSLPVSLQALPLLWLGAAEDADSLALLKDLFEKSKADKVRSRLLSAVALHRNPSLVVPFLEHILKSREAEGIRADAASFLGEQNDRRALDVLVGTIKADASLEVRKNAVGGLAEMELPAAADALVDFARNSPDKRIREEAVQGLSEKATTKAVSALEQIAFRDKDTEVQIQAVQALAELPSKEGLPYLMRVAKTHAIIQVRKAAIERLGEMDDPAAIQALFDIIKGKS